MEVGAGDGVLLLHLSVGGCARDDGGGDGGGLHDLHCWFGSLWAIWRLVLHWRTHRVRLHVFGNRSIPLDLKPEIVKKRTGVKV